MLTRLPPWLAHRAAVPGLILICCLVAYANSFGNSFHYDDSHSIVDNPHIRSLAQVPRFFVDPGAFSAMPATRMYRPLLLVTYALNHAVGGYDVFGYHVVNFLLHVVNALLVWVVARRLTGQAVTALVAGLIFAVHPVLGEPVNYISSRSSLLATAFCLGAFAVLVRGASGAHPWRARAAFTALFVGGLLSKSIAIVLPALGGAYLVWSRRRPIASRGEGGAASLSWTGIAATLAGPAAVGLAYVVVTRAIIGKAMLEPVRSLVSHYATQIKALPYYAATAALPVHLSVEPQFAVSQAPGETAVALAGLAALSLGLVVAAGWRRGWLEAFGAVWFFLALAPSAAVPLNVLVNEHRLYLPMVGASLALAHLVARARCPAWVPLAGLAIMVALTFQRNRVWRTEETLWGDAVATGPAMSRSHLNLGKAYLEQERYEEAIASSRRSLAIDPDLDRAHYNIGTAYLSQRQFEAAVASYERALEINPRLMEAVNNLGNAYKEQGLYEAALDQYRQALALADHGAIHHNLGSAFLAAGQRDSAIAHFDASIERDPDNRTAYEGLVRAHLQGDELERAAAVLARASSRWPRAVDMALLHGDVQAALGRDTEALARYLLGGLSDGAARLRLGSQARRRGDWARARRHYEEALQTEPDNARLHNALGEAHHAAGQTREALREYRRAAELAPDFAEAYANIGLVYVQNRRPVEAVAALERAVSLDPGQDLAWGLLGRARGELGRAAEAVAAYERAVELAPQKAEHWSDLAALHQEAGAAAAAEAAYRAALSRDPGLTRARYGLGVSLVEQRRYAEGAAAIERALGQGYDRPEAHINLAAARLNLGQGRAALQAYEEFLERAPGDDPLRPRVQGQVRALRQRLEAEGGS